MSTEFARVEYQIFRELAPAPYAALQALGKAVDDSGLDKQLTEIVKIRVSQINGCAFCIQYHLNAARKAGVVGRKLDLLAAWREAGVFSARECAALAWAESLSAAGSQGAPDQTYDRLSSQFTQTEIVFLTVAIGAINNWNRIALGLRFTPPAPTST